MRMTARLIILIFTELVTTKRITMVLFCMRANAIGLRKGTYALARIQLDYGFIR